jgi:outer membrane biosynthesis protein TonB
MKLDEAKLNLAIEALNNSPLLEKNKIAKINTKKKSAEELLKLFADAVDAVPNEEVNELPETVIDFYMSYVNPPSGGETETKNESAKEKENTKMETKKKVVPEKKPVPVAKKKEPEKKPATPPVKKKEPEKKAAPAVKKPVVKKTAVKKVIEKDEFGYKVGSQANIIDKALLVGATVKEMAAKCKSTESRVRSHLYSLAKLKGFNIVVKDGKYIYVKGKKK